MTQPGSTAPENQAQPSLLATLKSTPSAYPGLRATPQAATILQDLAAHATLEADRTLAATYLALAFPHADGVRAFFFSQFRAKAKHEDYAALYAILANYAEDPGAIAGCTAILRALTPGDIAALLRRSLAYAISPDGRTPPHLPPMGVPKEEWQAWHSRIKAALLHMLPHPDMQALLRDLLQRDPDGPVECTLEGILRDLPAQLPQVAHATPLYLAAEHTARGLLATLAACHPAWPRLEDYLAEFDGIEKRRLGGWSRAYFMFDTDLETRQARILQRMAQFPDRAALRRTLEAMLRERPPVYPKVRDEDDYYRFEPLYWRATAYRALVAGHWQVADAVAFARQLIAAGPTDAEARAIKEAIEVAVRSWPTDPSVQTLLAEAQAHAALHPFITQDMARLCRQAQNGKNIRLDRNTRSPSPACP